ncbi:MAG: carbonic anhydrase, partial [Chloroflexota bacterium]
IRVAGNILDDAVLGSLEFAVAKLQVPVIMVLGHQNCGAVDAAVQGLQPPGHLGKIVETIQPAVELVKDHQGDWLDNAIRANAQQVSYQLNTMPGFTTPIEANQLMIVPAYYDLFDGTVALL